MLAQQRRTRLIDAMAEAGLDLMVVYGNAWQNDYLRYATDFGILEGQALALVRSDGQVTLYLDSPLEVDRTEIECPDLDVVHAPDLGLNLAREAAPRLEEMSIEEVEAFLIKKTLARCDGNARRAAEELGLSRSAFYRRLEKYGL